MSSGKWYWEVTSTNDTAKMIGIATSLAPVDNWAASSAYGWIYNKNGYKYHNGGYSGYGASYTTGDVIGVAFDADNGSLAFYKNGASQGTAYTGLTSGPYFPVTSLESASSVSVNFGARAFAHPLSGYKSLNTANLPEPTIPDGSKYFDTKLFTANASTQSIPLGFSPDFVWLKSRANAYGNEFYDIVRGVNKRLTSNTTGTEQSAANQLTAFNSDGFTLGDASSSNYNSGTTSVGWAWDGGTSTVSNTDGSITSNVRANPTAGFSIVSYTGGGGSGATVGHGLNSKPELIILKSRTAAENWFVNYPVGTGDGYLMLNQTNAGDGSNATVWNSTAPTSSVFTLGSSSGVNGSQNYIAYCFAPVNSYSAMGSYVGNGSADGTFVYTGFKVAWLMVKKTNGAGMPWQIQDATRSPFNDAKHVLMANYAWAEASSNPNIDLLSNGFKPRRGSGYFNSSNDTFLYLAFASHPFKTARAR
jgi:hypothetical protein